MAIQENFTTPVMRLVQGDAFEAQTKDAQGRPRLIQSGPNAGQPAIAYFVAGAIPKNHPDMASWPNSRPDEMIIDAPGLPPRPSLAAILMKVAAGSWPHFFPQGVGPGINPNFSFKVVDGDGIGQYGKPNASKDGFAGHWIIRFNSSYPPKVVRSIGNGMFATLRGDIPEEKVQVKRGYFVRVSGNVTSNENVQKPGLYVNLGMIELVGLGAEIVGGPDPSQAFSQPAALPAGAQALPPMQGGGAPAPAYTPSAAPVTPPVTAGQVAPAAATYTPPSTPAAPYSGFMHPGGAAPAAPGAASPALAASPPAVAAPPPASMTASPARVMLPAAQGLPYEQYVAAGWSDDQLIAHGMMAA